MKRKVLILVWVILLFGCGSSKTDNPADSSNTPDTNNTTSILSNDSSLERGEVFFETLERFNRYYTDSTYTSNKMLFVAPNGSGDGTKSSPMSVDNAFNQALAGTEIRFLSGQYSGCWELAGDHSGSYDAPIVLKAEADVEINCCSTGRKSCFNLEYANYIAIDGFHLIGGDYGVRSVGGYATSEHQKGIAILNNHGENQYRDPFFSGGSDWIVVEGNIANGAGSGDGHGIYLSNGSDWMIVRNNNLYNNSSSDFQINADPISTCEEEGIAYDDSRCDGSALDGLGQGVSEFILVENNYFHHSEVGPNFTSVRNSIIRNNIIGFYNRHNTSFWQESDNPKLGSSNNTVEHNLFIGNNSSHLLQFIHNATNNQVRNNVLLGISGDNHSINNNTLLIEQDSSTQNSNHFESNYLVGGYFEYYIPSGTNQQNSNFNTNWFENFPHDKKGDIYGFKPTDNAPFLNLGQLQNTSTQDIAGNSRFNPVDLGPWEVNSNATSPNPNPTHSTETQYISHMLDGHARVIEAKVSGAVTDISDHLLTLDSGEESWINISPNGEWLLMESSRLNSECSGWACLIYGKRDLSEFKVIMSSSGAVMHPEGFSAIANGGDVIVAHMIEDERNDIFVSKKTGTDWSTPQSISSTSPSDNNRNPAISANGEEVLFSCGENICMVDIDGSNLKTVIKLSDKPVGSWSQIKSADFDINGDIVFEAEDDSERIWRYNRSSLEVSVINASQTNDNSPCVLSDGNIASLWLNRPNNSSGGHELKIMNATGSNYSMIIEDKDISDFGIGCGGL